MNDDFLMPMDSFLLVTAGQKPENIGVYMTICAYRAVRCPGKPVQKRSPHWRAFCRADKRRLDRIVDELIADGMLEENEQGEVWPFNDLIERA